MSNRLEVTIDGERYVPIREVNAPLREAIARAIAAEWWGDLGVDWETQWRRHMYTVHVIVTDSTRDGISADEFLDNICARLVEAGKEVTSG